MHLLQGHPAAISVPHLHAREAVVDVVFSPKGNIFCVLTQRQLQFWGGLKHMVLLHSLALPGCSVEAAAEGTECALNVAWHPHGRSLAISTSERRLIFVEADIAAGAHDVVSMHSERDELRFVDAASRVCISFTVQLDFGMLVKLCATNSTLLLTTSAGFVVVIQWSTGKVLHALNASYFLQQHIDNLPASVGGSIVSFTHSVKLQLCGLVLSDGSVCVLRNHAGNDFHGENLSFSGTCTPNIGAQMVEFNAKHALLAAACPSARVKVFSIVEVDGTVHPERPSALSLQLFETAASGITAWCDHVESLGSIRLMQWSGDEESLCIGYKHLGLAVFHYSGVCSATSFQRYTYNERAHHANSLLPGGVSAAAWDSGSFRLFVCSPRSRTITVCSFSRPATVQPPTEGERSAVVVMQPTAFSLFHPSDADGVVNNWETLSVPEEYMQGNYPLRFCAVSPDASHVACAGTYGCVLHNRKMRRWRMFGVQRQERSIRVIASPVWVRNLCVVLPVRNITKSRFELVAYPRFHLDEASILDTFVVDRRPEMVSCFGNFVAVIDLGQHLTILEAETAVDNIITPRTVSLGFKRRYSVSLLRPHHHALALAVCPLPKEQSALARSAHVPMIALLRRDHTLCTIDPSAAASASGSSTHSSSIHNSFGIIDNAVCSFWLDATALSTSGCMAVLTSGLKGVAAHIIPLSSAGSTPGSQLSTPTLEASRQRSLARSFSTHSPGCAWPLGLGHHVGHVADFDCESMPLGVLPIDGFVIFGAEGIDRRYALRTLPPLYEISVKPVLYQHRILLPLFLSADVDDGCSAGRQSAVNNVVQLLRRNGCFVDTLDYLIHTVIHEELHLLPTSAAWARTAAIGPDGSGGGGGGGGGGNGGGGGGGDSGGSGAADGGAAFDRRRALHSVVRMLRKYPEYHEVVVGCVRKTDVAKWRPIFDVIGSPHDFFNECIEANKLREAAHVVRALLMDKVDDTKASLEAASQGARRLFSPVLLRLRDFHLAYELLRYITLLELEIDLPPVVVAETPLTGIEKALRTVWPIGQTKKAAPASAATPPVSTVVRRAGTGSIPGAAASMSAGSAASGITLPDSFSAAAISSPTSRALRHQTQKHDHSDAVMWVLVRYQSELEAPLVALGVELLRTGHIAQLCTCFEVFDLDLSFFITSQWRGLATAPPLPTRSLHAPSRSPSPPEGLVDECGGGATCAPKGAPGVELLVVFDAVHLEFGLPRCPSGELRQWSMDPTESAAAAENSAMDSSLLLAFAAEDSDAPSRSPCTPGDEEVRLMLGNSLRLLTATQEHLAVMQSTLFSLFSLLKLFMFHDCAEFILVLSTLLLQPDIVRRVLNDRPDLEQKWVMLLSRPENAGYRRLLNSVVPDARR